MYRFKLPSRLHDLDINKVKLYFNVRPRSKNAELNCKKYQKQSLDITIKDVINYKNITLTKRVPRRRPKHGWYSVRNSTKPLTQLLILYKKHKKDHIQMAINCPDCCSHPMSEEFLPILVVQASKPIMLRDADDTVPKCFSKCCVKPLIVDFDELGYDWVIHPRRYTANYCEGSCRRHDLLPSDVSQLSTNTLIVQAMLKERNINSAGSSCVPKHTTPVRIVYHNSAGAIRTSTLQTVNSCQCSWHQLLRWKVEGQLVTCNYIYYLYVLMNVQIITVILSCHFLWLRSISVTMLFRFIICSPDSFQVIFGQ